MWCPWMEQMALSFGGIFRWLRVLCLVLHSFSREINCPKAQFVSRPFHSVLCRRDVLALVSAQSLRDISTNTRGDIEICRISDEPESITLMQGGHGKNGPLSHEQWSKLFPFHMAIPEKFPHLSFPFKKRSLLIRASNFPWFRFCAYFHRLTGCSLIPFSVAFWAGDYRHWVILSAKCYSPVQKRGPKHRSGWNLFFFLSLDVNIEGCQYRLRSGYPSIQWSGQIRKWCTRKMDQKNKKFFLQISLLVLSIFLCLGLFY